jgi:hypothetical protein
VSGPRCGVASRDIHGGVELISAPAAQAVPTVTATPASPCTAPAN